MGAKVDPPQAESVEDVYNRLAGVLTPSQVDQLVESIYTVRRSGGYGKVVLEYQAGTIKFFATEIRKPV